MQGVGATRRRSADGDRRPQRWSVVIPNGDRDALGAPVEKATPESERAATAHREAHGGNPIRYAKPRSRAPGSRTREQQREPRPRRSTHGQCDGLRSSRDRNHLRSHDSSVVRMREPCEVVGRIDDQRTGNERTAKVAIPNECGVRDRRTACFHRDHRTRRASRSRPARRRIRPRTGLATAAADRNNGPGDEQGRHPNGGALARGRRHRKRYGSTRPIGPRDSRARRDFCCARRAGVSRRPSTGARLGRGAAVCAARPRHGCCC